MSKKLDTPNTTSFRESARTNAREWGARNLKRHFEKQGKDVSYESCKRYISERGDLIDKKKDRR